LAGLALARPFSVLISAALLLLTMVAGVGGTGGFAALGRTSAAPLSTAAAASAIAVPVVGERRAAPVLGSPGNHRHASGWSPHLPDPATAPGPGWQFPSGPLTSVVPAAATVVALTVQVSHRGRAPPLGLLLS
jgi:hypothetical protein